MALILLKLGFTLNNNSGLVVRKGRHASILCPSQFRMAVCFTGERQSVLLAISAEPKYCAHERRSNSIASISGTSHASSAWCAGC
jgi:hypothetical protein